MSFSLVVALLWPPLLAAILLKVFPDLIGKALLKVLDHRSEIRLARLRDELARETSVRVETLKAEVQASYATVKTSVDFLSASQSGLRGEMVAASRTLWKTILDLRREFGGMTTFLGVFRPEEMSTALTGKSDQKILDLVMHYRDEGMFRAVVDRFTQAEVEETRLFVGDRLWLLFHVIRAIYFRLALLVGRSLRERTYADWRHDKVVNDLVRSVLPVEFLEGAKGQELQGVQAILGRLEAAFLHEAARVMSGSKAFAESLSDLQATLLLQTERGAGPGGDGQDVLGDR